MQCIIEQKSVNLQIHFTELFCFFNLRSYLMEKEDSEVAEEASFDESAENYRVIRCPCSPNVASFARSGVVFH